jgi:hypothetical protein
VNDFEILSTGQTCYRHFPKNASLISGWHFLTLRIYFSESSIDPIRPGNRSIDLDFLAIWIRVLLLPGCCFLAVPSLFPFWRQQPNSNETARNTQGNTFQTACQTAGM